MRGPRRRRSSPSSAVRQLLRPGVRSGLLAHMRLAARIPLTMLPVANGKAQGVEMAGSGILTKHSLKWVLEKGWCSPIMVDTLTALGYRHLTTVQLLAVPHLLTKVDTYIHARTGSGKTLAFLIPTLERLKAMGFKSKHGVGALIISPTRELAKQISTVLNPLAEAFGFSCALVTGGTKVKCTHIEKGCVLVIGTPGRLAEALTNEDDNCPKVCNLKIVILDEADRLLDDGSHTQQLRRIVSVLPKEQVQKVLVSATSSSKCQELMKEIFVTDFSFISAEKDAAFVTSQVMQKYLFVPARERLSMLVTVLQALQKKKVIVFFNSCHSVKFHHRVLNEFNLPVYYCMGQEKQARRSNTYSKFVEVTRGILLTTGLAERGWDIPGVQWIIQYDPPHKPEDYIHRVGRTSRGEGCTGQALLFLRPEECNYLDVLRGMEVKLDEIEFSGDLKNVQNKMNSYIAHNADIQQMGKTAYKKYVRAYQCHKLKKIFNIHELDLNEICFAFGFTKPPIELGHLT
ncbi:uncharacterized protein LOC126996660 isoform X2 [Eriocheir sinensis]|uniref:uncharacterized protein LOC126996660 isoform X2 n=1 Tax=Eriocheir sinensis TaxID=95602 RepID=UPI0021CA0E20|nr:uncharacterized protein LOC126996660 isoform X2 [Eriocheir sinensis]